MLCTDKGSMVKTHSTVLNGLHASLIRLFQDDQTAVTRVYYPLQVFIIDWLLMFVNQVHVRVDFAYLLL